MVPELCSYRSPSLFLLLPHDHDSRSGQMALKFKQNKIALSMQTSSYFVFCLVGYQNAITKIGVTRKKVSQYKSYLLAYMAFSFITFFLILLVTFFL
jgi:hypothetical protein